MVNPLRHMADRYRRWRHSRGYGVHSPFAYMLVREALYPDLGYSYYLENDARLDSADPAESRRARALYRLAITLRCNQADPLRIYLWKDAPDVYRTALKMGGATLLPSLSTTDYPAILPPEMLIPASGDNTDSLHGILRLISRHFIILIPGRHMADTEYTLP